MNSLTGLRQPTYLAVLKVRVLTSRNVHLADGQSTEDRAREIVQRYLSTGTITFSTLDDSEFDFDAYVITVLLQGFGDSRSHFDEYEVAPQIDRIHSSMIMRVTETSLYAPIGA